MGVYLRVEKPVQRYDADLSSSAGWTVEHSYWQPNELCTISGWTITAPNEWWYAYQNINLDFSNAKRVEFNYDMYPVFATWSASMGVTIWSQPVSNQFSWANGNCTVAWVIMQSASWYNTATTLSICQTEVGSRYTTGTWYQSNVWTTYKSIIDFENLTAELYIWWTLISSWTFDSSLVNTFRSNPNNVLSIYLSSYNAIKNLYITVE